MKNIENFSHSLQESQQACAGYSNQKQINLRQENRLKKVSLFTAPNHKSKINGSSTVYCLILITVFLVYFISQFESNQLGNEKIMLQNQADFYAQDIMNIQADALNSIAAYNQGIKIASNRAFMVSSALMLLRTCSALTLFASPCTKYWLRLEKKAGKFFKKTQTLMDHMHEQQSKIIAWSEEKHRKHIQYLKLTLLKQKKALIVYPKVQNHTLPVIQAKNKSKFDKHKQCKQKKIQSFYQFKQHHLKPLQEFEESQARYQSASGQWYIIKFSYKNSKSLQQKVYNNNKAYHFKDGAIKRCETFKNLMLKLNKKIPFRFKVPAPYIIDQEKWQEQQNFALALAHKIKKNTLLKNITSKKYQKNKIQTVLLNKNHHTLWVFSQSYIQQNDLSKMIFKPNPVHVHLIQMLNQNISNQKAQLLLRRFSLPKQIKTF